MPEICANEGSYTTCEEQSRSYIPDIDTEDLTEEKHLIAYRPDYCPVSCFVDDFMEKYSQALTFGKNIIVTADLNCDMLKPRPPEAVALQNLRDSVNLTQLIKEPTRVTETSSTLIDVIMTSSIDLVERSGVLKSHVSDHYLVYALLKLKISKPPPSYVKV